ncbi:MAG: thiamine pyrophosphate-dependent enzyme [bacterium]
MIAALQDIIAFALVDLGIKVVTYVPGYGASETFDSYNLLAMRTPIISFHEETAFSIAHGASIVGVRSAVFIKAQGFMKAGNAATDSLYAQNIAGFVTFIFDDVEGSNSDNILEIEPILNGMAYPFKMTSGNSVYDDIVKAYLYSEQKKQPITIIIKCTEIGKSFTVARRQNLKKSFTYTRDIFSHVVNPIFAEYQYKVFTAKKLGVDTSTVLRSETPTIPENIPAKYKSSVEKYMPFFNIFKQLRGSIVTGDTSTSGMFVLPPFNCIDIITHLGGSIPLAIGAYLAGYKSVWALTGDFGFISAGHIGLLEAFNRQIPLKIVIFYNKEASATGGQKIPKNILKHILAGYSNSIIHISNPNDLIELNTKLIEANESDEMKIIIVDF